MNSNTQPATYQDYVNWMASKPTPSDPYTENEWDALTDGHRWMIGRFIEQDRER